MLSAGPLQVLRGRSREIASGASSLLISEDRAANVVGIDPHKRTLTATVVDGRGGIVSGEHFRVSGDGHRAPKASGAHTAPRQPRAALKIHFGDRFPGRHQHVALGLAHSRSDSPPTGALPTPPTRLPCAPAAPRRGDDRRLPSPARPRSRTPSAGCCLDALAVRDQHSDLPAHPGSDIIGGTAVKIGDELPRLDASIGSRDDRAKIIAGGQGRQAHLNSRIARLEHEIDALLARRPTHEPNRKLLKHLAAEREHLLTFLKTPGIAATNSRAEQATRPAVVNRKNWGGNRTSHGAEVWQTLMSVIRPSRQQDVCPIALLENLLRQRMPAPSNMLRCPPRPPRSAAHEQRQRAALPRHRARTTRRQAHAGHRHLRHRFITAVATLDADTMQAHFGDGGPRHLQQHIAAAIAHDYSPRRQR
jgi:Transposase IS66 family